MFKIFVRGCIIVRYLFHSEGFKPVMPNILYFSMIKCIKKGRVLCQKGMVDYLFSK